MFHKFRCLILVMALCVTTAANAEFGRPWPMYRHDIARSGVTAERLKMPLRQSWVFEPRHPPKPAWGDPPPGMVAEGVLELRRVHFDDASQVVVANGAVYLGSSSEDKVFCLDLESGAIRWTAITEGPVRLAPMYSEGRLYYGADDGYAYCLNAFSGKLIWKFHAAPENRHLLGNGRMISLWPIRTGVLVDGGDAFFGAGIHPDRLFGGRERRASPRTAPCRRRVTCWRLRSRSLSRWAAANPPPSTVATGAPYTTSRSREGIG